MSLELFERPSYGERAILVSIDFGGDHDELLREFTELAVSSGAEPVATVTGSRNTPDARYFIGSGKLEEIKQITEQTEAEIVLFNHRLSPSQERNLEQALCCRVLDRTGLILDIFAQRARSFEGKLQVELAQLQHLSSRLVRGWTHLERQKGGIGLRGPGETQLETDRRLVSKRIAHLQKRLGKVSKQRQQSRRTRIRAEVPTISLVGYTNAGKSTVFNWLTGAKVHAEDQLFATLDPTIRRLKVPGFGEAVLADTVGFIRDLPHDLVAAFQSTLEETLEADLLLHVVDVHNEEKAVHMEQVNQVLEQIGAQRVPQIVVYNKIDLKDQSPELTRSADGNTQSVSVSAAMQNGLPLLMEALADFFQTNQFEGWITLSASEWGLRSQLFDNTQILAEENEGDGSCRLHLRISREQLRRLAISPARITQIDQPVDPKPIAGIARAT